MRKVVINLQFREDRRAEMQTQLSDVGWQAEFFSAIRPEDSGGFPSVGARGCFLSHLSILQQARDDAVESLVIMEDDLNFAKDFKERWQAAHDELLAAHSWSIFYPGNEMKESGKGLTRVPPHVPVVCSHFMMFNGSALDVIVRELEAILGRPPGNPEGGPMHVDGAYSTIRTKNPDLSTFCYSPALGYQRASRTDIGENKLFDRIQFLRTPIRKLRRIKRYLLRR